MPETITMALWSTSKGRQRDATQYLLDRGGDLNGIGWDDQTCLDNAPADDDLDISQWLQARGAKPAADVEQP